MAARGSAGGSARANARHRARRLLVQALYQAQLNPLGRGEFEAQFRADNDFGNVDEDYFGAGLRAVLRDPAAIDELFAAAIDRDLDELDPVARAVLRLGAWELRDRVDVPYRVVIDQGVQMAKLYGAAESHRYINAVLDRLARRLRTPETAAPPQG